MREETESSVRSERSEAVGWGGEVDGENEWAFKAPPTDKRVEDFVDKEDTKYPDEPTEYVNSCSKNPVCA